MRSEARILNILDFFGSSESSLQEFTTVDVASIWAGDRVHLTSNSIRVAAMKLMQNLANSGVSGEPACKRARLSRPRYGCRASCRQANAAEGRAVSKEARSEAGETALVREEDIVCTMGPAQPDQGADLGAAPGAATRAAGVAGDNIVVKAALEDGESDVIISKCKLQILMC